MSPISASFNSPATTPVFNTPNIASTFEYVSAKDKGIVIGGWVGFSIGLSTGIFVGMQAAAVASAAAAATGVLAPIAPEVGVGAGISAGLATVGGFVALGVALGGIIGTVVGSDDGGPDAPSAGSSEGDGPSIGIGPFTTGGGTSEGGEGGESGGGCFCAGTQVLLADGNSISIEMLRVGDLVASRDERTGALTGQRTTRIFKHNVEATLALELANGEELFTTSEHRFHVAGSGFVGAGRFEAGTSITTYDGNDLRVLSSTPRKERATVYNLEVENFHTYFVGQDRVWVHNLKTAPVDPKTPDE